MSIDHLRKQAKNLHRLLPAFIAEYANTALTLSVCQELAARINGYPNWHAAAQRKSGGAASAAAIENEGAAVAHPTVQPDPLGSLYFKMDAMEDKARQLHFEEVGGKFLYALTHDDEHKPVLEFLIAEGDQPSEAAADALHADIEHGYRMSRDPDATIVLNIQAPVIPPFVLGAVRRFQFFGISLVVLHGEECSLDPDSDFPPEVMSLIKDAGGQGQVWHPILRKRVWMHPRP